MKDITVITRSFEEPTLKAVEAANSYRPKDHIVGVNDEDLEGMIVTLLATAQASGRVITIENIGIPERGMGGYYSLATIRPDYGTVRSTMDELERRRAAEKTAVDERQVFHPLGGGNEESKKDE